MKTAVLLPVYNPDVKFPALVRELKERGFVVVVCNDGSSEKYDPIFNEIKDEVYYVTYNSTYMCLLRIITVYSYYRKYRLCK